MRCARGAGLPVEDEKSFVEDFRRRIQSDDSPVTLDAPRDALPNMVRCAWELQSSQEMQGRPRATSRRSPAPRAVVAPWNNLHRDVGQRYQPGGRRQVDADGSREIGPSLARHI